MQASGLPAYAGSAPGVPAYARTADTVAEQPTPPDASAEARPVPAVQAPADLRPLPVPPAVDRVTERLRGAPEAMRGLAGWIDVYDYSDADPVGAGALADFAADRGVRVLWVETSRYNTAEIAMPRALGALLDRAHARRLRVLAWTLPEFADSAADAARAMAAARFRSPRGDRVDAVGLDIEVATVQPPSLRSERLIALARQLHHDLRVPLVGIVPPPIGFERHPDYWPGFPWRDLSTAVDGLALMGYWTYSSAEPGAYTRTALAEARRLVGNARYPLNAVGGLAAGTTAAGVVAFCAAARDGGALGAGLYDVRSTPASSWPALGECRRLGR